MVTIRQFFFSCFHKIGNFLFLFMDVDDDGGFQLSQHEDMPQSQAQDTPVVSLRQDIGPLWQYQSTRRIDPDKGWYSAISDTTTLRATVADMLMAVRLNSELFPRLKDKTHFRVLVWLRVRRHSTTSDVEGPAGKLMLPAIELALASHWQDNDCETRRHAYLYRQGSSSDFDTHLRDFPCTAFMLQRVLRSRDNTVAIGDTAEHYEVACAQLSLAAPLEAILDMFTTGRYDGKPAELARIPWLLRPLEVPNLLEKLRDDAFLSPDDDSMPFINLQAAQRVAVTFDDVAFAPWLELTSGKDVRAKALSSRDSATLLASNELRVLMYRLSEFPGVVPGAAMARAYSLPLVDVVEARQLLDLLASSYEISDPATAGYREMPTLLKLEAFEPMRAKRTRSVVMQDAPPTVSARSTLQLSVVLRTTDQHMRAYDKIGGQTQMVPPRGMTFLARKQIRVTTQQLASFSAILPSFAATLPLEKRFDFGNAARGEIFGRTVVGGDIRVRVAGLLAVRIMALYTNRALVSAIPPDGNASNEDVAFALIGDTLLAQAPELADAYADWMACFVSAVVERLFDRTMLVERLVSTLAASNDRIATIRPSTTQQPYGREIIDQFVAAIEPRRPEIAAVAFILATQMANRISSV